MLGLAAGCLVDVALGPFCSPYLVLGLALALTARRTTAPFVSHAWCEMSRWATGDAEERNQAEGS